MDQIFDEYKKKINERVQFWKDGCEKLLALNSNRPLPVVIKFKEELETEFTKNSSDHFFAVIEIVKFKDPTKPHEFSFRIKAGHDSFYYLRALPIEKVSKIEIHPEFKPSFPAIAPQRGIDEFNNYLLELLEKDVFTNVVFEFSHKIALHPWSIIPSDTYKIPVKVQELKAPGETTFTYKVCLYIKSSKNGFYRPDFIPYQHITGIYLESEFSEPLRIWNKERSIRIKRNEKIEFDYSGIEKDWEELDISSLLKNISIERNDCRCLLCGRETPSPGHFALLLSNGNIVNKISYPVKENVVGFKPIGSECMKKVGSDFTFTKAQMEAHESSSTIDAPPMMQNQIA